MGPLALYRKSLLDKGITKDSEEYESLMTSYRKKFDRERKKKQYLKAKSDPIAYEKYREAQRRRDRVRRQREKADPIKLAKSRERNRLRKQKKRLTNKEEYNARQRDYYNRNKERIRALIYAGKERRNPLRNFTSVERQLSQGKITLREYVRRLNAKIVQLDALTNGSSGKKIPE